MGTLRFHQGHSDGVSKGTIVIRLYVIIDMKALTADISQICRSRSVCLLSPEEGVLPSVTSLSTKFVEVYLPQPVLYDDRFIWFELSLLPFPIVHHSFPTIHSFNHHFRSIHFHHHCSLSLGYQSFNQHSQDKIS